MSKYSDPGKHLRESIRLMGEGYHQVEHANRKLLKIKSISLARIIIGLVGVGLLFFGMNVMDNGNLHLSFRFAGLVLFGVGISMSLQLVVGIFVPVISYVSRMLNKRRLKRISKGSEKKI